MRTLVHSTDINAPPDTTWTVVAALEAYEQWNPFMVNASGALAIGERLTFRLRAGRRVLQMRPRITELAAGRKVAWLGRFLVPHVLDGQHELIVEPLGAGRSRFTQRERFTGILVPALGGLLKETDAGFAAMNEALKRRAESLAAGNRRG